MKFKKILITGSSGTIGTRLFEKLLEKKYQVVGFDRRPNEWKPELNKKTIKGDLLKTADLSKIPKGIDLIVHLAANARVYELVEDPKRALENITTTFNALEFSRKNGTPSFIFAGSREVYGNRDRIVSSEKDVDIDLCESPYAASKLAGEALTHAYGKCYGIDYIIVRFSNVYGMYDDSDRFIPLFFRKMIKNQKVVIFGKDKTLDFTYIDDAVGGVMKVIEKFAKVNSEAINLAKGKGERLLDVANLLKEKLGSESLMDILSSRTGEVTKYVADISKAKKMLGYSPRYGIELGIAKTVEWYKENLYGRSSR